MAEPHSERIIPREEAIILSAAGGYAAPRLARAARRCRSLEDLLRRSDRDLMKLPGIGEKSLAQLRKVPQVDLEREFARLDALGLAVLVPGTPGWPKILSENVPVPPLALYVRGDPAPLAGPAVAVVGTRRPSDAGIRMGRQLGYDLGLVPLVVVSGLATGIDALAHGGCLEAGGSTVAVLAHGLDSIHPKGNRGLAEQILAQGGALVSEYHPGVRPLPETFVPRNRIIAGLALATVIVEGKEDSGARHTAAFAVTYDRPVLAVPGTPFTEQAALPNELLRTGAAVCRGAYDVLANLPAWKISGLQNALAARAEILRKQAEAALKALGPEARTIISALPDEPLHVDGICRLTRLEPARVLSLLLQMEMEGIVEQLPGMRYVPNYRPPDS